MPPQTLQVQVDSGSAPFWVVGKGCTTYEAEGLEANGTPCTTSGFVYDVAASSGRLISPNGYDNEGYGSDTTCTCGQARSVPNALAPLSECEGKPDDHCCIYCPYGGLEVTDELHVSQGKFLNVSFGVVTSEPPHQAGKALAGILGVNKKSEFQSTSNISSFSLYLEPPRCIEKGTTGNSFMVLDGEDPNFYKGELVQLAKVSGGPFDDMWSVQVIGLKTSDGQLALGIYSSSGSNILIPSNPIMNAAVYDSGTSLLMYSPDFGFTIPTGNASISLTIALKRQGGGKPVETTLTTDLLDADGYPLVEANPIVSDLGVGFLMGEAWIRTLYSSFDFGTGQVSAAPAIDCTLATNPSN